MQEFTTGKADLDGSRLGGNELARLPPSWLAICDDFTPHLHELRLGIDYIFEWVGFDKPAEQSGHWISPAILVLQPQRFHIDLPGPSGDCIIGIERSGADDSQKWIISLNTGGDRQSSEW